VSDVHDQAPPEPAARHQREPIPPQVPRSDALGRLRRERWFAQDTGDLGRVAEIDRQIAELSASSTPVPPGRETTSAAVPRRERSATTRKRK
jgi:hypothetical protein